MILIVSSDSDIYNTCVVGIATAQVKILLKYILTIMYINDIYII